MHESLPEKDGRGAGSLLFERPRDVITCRSAYDIEEAFAAANRASAAGYWLAGGFAYELGYLLESRLASLAGVIASGDHSTPLFQLGVFEAPQRLSPADADALVADRAEIGLGAATVDTHTENLHYGEARDDYVAKLARLRDYITAGDIYQANFTFPLRFPWPANAWTLYGRLAAHQRVCYGAVLDLPDMRAASLSPELFFRKRGDAIESHPMKGTLRRGRTPEEDARLVDELRRDGKSRAENLMIVDLIRNDLGRIARVGGVSVDGLFDVETYETLHQMVSTVRATARADLSLAEVLRHIFPCGSVTGAPKIRAMEIIAELETEPRGVYTGAIGYVSPDRDMCFSVPIRTAVLEHDGMARLGIGSGVVFDSDPEAEYEECLLKAQFAQRALTPPATPDPA
ncbi:MAG TPA: aminodeoxychorismate synthase component I [Gammaproteobacteria bacterium]|nr:aminodeoxychorismate synthase component I [Gammaproteobacteria bacterium]